MKRLSTNAPPPVTCAARKPLFAFVRIGDRILVWVGLVIVLGLIGLSVFHISHQEAAILAQNERSMKLLTTTVNDGLKAVMVTGNGQIAQIFAHNLRQHQAIDDFRILRTDGTEAFKDNKTIEVVNRRLGGVLFAPRPTEEVVPVLAPDDPNLRRVLATGQELPLYELNPGNGQRQLTFLAAIGGGDSCQSCHGEGSAARGVIRLTTSMEQAERDIQHTRQESYLILFMVLLLVLSVIAWLIRRTVAQPVARITQAMGEVAAGDLAQRLPVVSWDELGVMADCFNRMSEQLFQMHSGLSSERDKLTTIILSSREGIVVTDGHDNMVLVNPTMERLLGKSREQIVQGGLLQIVDDPSYMSALLDPTREHVPSVIVYNNHILNIYASTISTASGVCVGSAALVRDITQEKKLEEKLRKLSTTDALTGLYNRRWLDSTLSDEFQRAKRYDQSLGFLILDVDHFKRFNDTHGHDQGDRVLQVIGRVMQEHFREVDHPCRFGGEEFCAILPNTGHPGTALAADRLRQKVEAMVVDGLQVTISVGAAVFPTVGLNPEDLLKQADLALYRAKEGGRNRVCFAEAEPSPAV
ncbi:MAG: diguanylate cyclase [Magnetococcus sp. MYC-9]